MILQQTDENTHLNYSLIDFCSFTLSKAKHVNGGRNWCNTNDTETS